MHEEVGHTGTARDFLVNYFPNELLQQIDFDQLAIQKDSFIEKELKETFSD